LDIEEPSLPSEVVTYHFVSSQQHPLFRTASINTMKPYIAVPAIAALVYRAWSRKSLTPVGIFAAFVTAIVHAIHPWSVFFALLAVFFLAGTTVTKVFDLGEQHDGN
jgi:uncharacterized membrane protein